MNVAFLSLGGNLGNRLGYLRQAQSEIEAQCGKIASASSVYETEPWGHQSLKPYLNQVLKLETHFNPLELLKRIGRIEKKFGRERKQGEILDRTIDIDVLLFNDFIINTDTIQVPHPRLHLRKFVLVPLNEIAPHAYHPVLKKPVLKLLKVNKDKAHVRTYKPNNLPFFICFEGNIGSGKTTLAKAFAKHLKANFLPETFSENALLPLFYEQPKRYAFLLEYSFLLSRFEQLQHKKLNEEAIWVSDFSFYKCLWFAKTNLPKREFIVFEQQFYKLLVQIRQPDIVIYLKTTLPNLQSNISKRGRQFESDISSNYLKKLSKNYDDGMAELKNPFTLLLNIDAYHSRLEKQVLKHVENYLKETFGWHI